MSPVPMVANGRTEERLRTDCEVESCPQALLQDQIRLAFSHVMVYGFGVDKLSWDPCLKGSFYRVDQAEADS